MIASFGMFIGCLLVLLLPLLGGCGGGGAGPGAVPIIPTPAPAEQPKPARAVPVALLGNSLLAGYIDGDVRALPVERIQQQLGRPIVVENLSISGTAARQFIEGVAPLDGVPYARWVAGTNAELIVIRYGGIEALYDPTHAFMSTFAADMEMMVDQAREHGRQVVLVGCVPIPENETANGAFQARYAAADATLREISARKGVPFIDLSGVPVHADEMHDAIHPGKVYQDRASDVIAARLAEIINQGIQ
ncbi:MAG: SGNH/GDSL hydrolase family protein [Comamonadaceae bacterium]|nr:MAG: SGNH/GDSL hydrolase family protein [Comamonadaceae bacterium]